MRTFQWITVDKRGVCLKDVSQVNAVKSYRPITCLPPMWRLLTGIIADEMYTFFDKNGICGTKEL